VTQDRDAVELTKRAFELADGGRLEEAATLYREAVTGLDPSCRFSVAFRRRPVANTQRTPASSGSRHFRLRVLGANYKARIFAYPEEGQMVVITPWSLRQITHELIVDVFAEIKGEQALAELADQPGLRIGSRYPEDLEPSAWATTPAEAPDETS